MPGGLRPRRAVQTLAMVRPLPQGPQEADTGAQLTNPPTF
jgi:hypothetical protein